MGPDHLRRLHEAFEASRRLPGDQLPAFLERLRGVDAGLAAEVEALHAAYGRAADDSGDDPALRQLLASTAAARAESVVDAVANELAADELAGIEVDGFRLLRQLGQGGMGIVFEAEQAAPRRRVALKIMRPSVADGRSRRFALEAAVLGRLHHPNIAQIHSYGTCRGPGGEQPFFAMELVDGVDLRTHAERHGFDVRQRLALFAQVCDGVQHAHEHDVVHRDLKPDNVLVDARGTPKVLDFGVAHAEGSSIDLASMQTQAGDLVGTLSYMAPEQLAGDPDAISPRTDVYALGVMAYELLCGRLPHEIAGLPVAAAVHVLTRTPPIPLERQAPALRGDVATLVGKAMEVEPARRYPSAAAFAADIRRHLADQPISARPPSAWYRAQKFTVRHRGLVAGVGSALLLLVLGLLGTGYGLRSALLAEEGERIAKRLAQEREQTAVASANEALRARDAEKAARKTAEDQLAKADRIAAFLSDLFLAARPAIALGRDTAVLVQMMDEAAARIERGELRDAPAAEFSLRCTVGSQYVTLGRAEAGRRLLSRALEMARGDGSDSRDLAVALSSLAPALARAGDAKAAVAMLRDSVAMQERLGLGATAHFAECLRQLANASQHAGDLRGAEATAARALALRRELAAGTRSASDASATGEGSVGSMELVEFLTMAASTKLAINQREPAEALLREAVAMGRGLYPAGHPSLAGALIVLGPLLLTSSRPEESAAVLREAYEMVQTLHAGDSEQIVNCCTSLAAALQTLGQLDDAFAAAERAVAMQRRLVPGDHTRLGAALNSLARVEQARKHPERAIALFREGLDMMLRLQPDDVQAIPPQQHNLAVLLQEQGDLAGAEPLFRDCIARMQKAFPNGHPYLALSSFHLATLLAAKGDAAAAEALHREVLAMRRQLFPKGHVWIAHSLEALAALVRARGDSAEAAGYEDEAKAVRAARKAPK